MIYLLTAIGLTPGGSSTVQYIFTHKQYTEQHTHTHTQIYSTTQK
jgi:hypothetical protein